MADFDRPDKKNGAWDYYQIYYPGDDDDYYYYFTTENDQNKKYNYTNMAGRGDDFDLDVHNIDPDTKVDFGDDDDEEEVNTTQPFQPQGASTPAAGPYHGGESHEMSEFGPEQSGLADTTPLLPQDQRERAWNATITFYPDASATDLEAFYDPKTKRLMVKMAGAGKKAYYLFTKEKRTESLRLNPKLTDEIRFALGQSAEDKLHENKQVIEETNQSLKHAKQEEKILNETVAKQQQAAQILQAKEAKLEQINQRIENIKNEAGTQMEIEIETDRLKRQKANIERDIEEAKETRKEYEKNYKKKKKQEKATKEVDLLQRKLADEERKRDAAVVISFWKNVLMSS